MTLIEQIANDLEYEGEVKIVSRIISGVVNQFVLRWDGEKYVVE